MSYSVALSSEGEASEESEEESEEVPLRDTQLMRPKTKILPKPMPRGSVRAVEMEA